MQSRFTRGPLPLRMTLFATLVALAACSGSSSPASSTTGTTQSPVGSAPGGSTSGGPTAADGGSASGGAGGTSGTATAPDGGATTTGGGTATTGGGQTPGATGKGRTVFVIVMENHDWSEIKGNSAAPYINGTLLPMASHAEGYMNPSGIHPSLPNYLWMASGTNWGILDDNDPSSHPLSSTANLGSVLNGANVSWKTYLEDVDGTSCPLQDVNLYAVRHNPFVYFTNLTGNRNPQDPACIAHNRPFSELAGDLANNTVPQFNFIVPNTCNDGHDVCSGGSQVQYTDNWLKANVPAILNSAAYKNGGALFITWDESENSDGPIGMMVLSPRAKGGGYSNSLAYDHSSLLRTVEETLGVSPLLGGAASASSLSDLFATYP